MNISNRLVLIVLLLCVFLLLCFFCFYCYYVFIDVRLSHLNKDYLLTYLLTNAYKDKLMALNLYIKI